MTTKEIHETQHQLQITIQSHEKVILVVNKTRLLTQNVSLH